MIENNLTIQKALSIAWSLHGEFKRAIWNDWISLRMFPYDNKEDVFNFQDILSNDWEVKWEKR